MSSNSMKKKPHAICVPFPAQGHINPMLKLAKLLHFNGFHITFVHTEFNYNRLIKSSYSHDCMINGLDDFRFVKISDGLPDTNQRGILDLPELCRTMPVHGQREFRELVKKLMESSDLPPVSCIVSDGVTGFTLDVAEELRLPEVMLFTPSGCGMLGYLHYGELVKRGIFPLHDEDCLTNGFLDTPIDWIPELTGLKLKHLPTFLRTTDVNDTMFNYNIDQMEIATRSKAVILNTFRQLEDRVLDAIKSSFPNVYTVGPISLLLQEITQNQNYLSNISSNLWKEDDGCLGWLDGKDPGSVVYVNFGSFVIMTSAQLIEFAWGLANSEYSFLWVIREDLVKGIIEAGKEWEDFTAAVGGRGLILGWCPQERVLRHRAVGGFLSHCGWNSTLESICEGKGLICWPFFAEQQMNCFYASDEDKWGIGMEIDSDVRREKVEGVVRELMGGDRGRRMRERCLEWKRKAEEATSAGGSSYNEFHLLVEELKKGT